MATATSSRTSSTCPSVSISVSSSSVNGGTQRYSYTVSYNTYGYKLSASSKPSVTAKIGSSTVYSGSITVGSKTSYTIKTGTLDVSKGTSATNLSISISINWGSIKWSGTTLGTRSGSSSIALPARTSYTVGYNANSGSGAPSSQTKWYNTTLTLSTTTPTRTGYTFSKWNTVADGTGTDYSSGASYTANAGATLYAQWTPNTYTITLDKNGGTGGTSSITKTYDQNVTLPSEANSPTRTSYKFLGWAESSSAQSAQYTAGSSYTKNITSNTTLYAIWELMYLPPSISNFQCYRSDSEGNDDDGGAYGCVKFSWKVDQTIGTSNVMESLTISANDDVKWSATPGGTSGTVTQIISDLDTDTTYIIKAVLKDTYADGKTITQSGFINTAFFTIDIKAGGNGIAFGKAAQKDDRFDLAWNMAMDNGKSIYGKRTDGTYNQVIGMSSSDNVYIGWDGYNSNNGDTNIYGKKVHIKSSVCNFDIGVNKVLWSGAYYMGSSQTATLSEAVSMQANGIVLIFSGYDSSSEKVLSSDFNCFFIPKIYVSHYNLYGMDLPVFNSYNIIRKYLYVGDTRITGATYNNTTNSVHGHETDSRLAVLREVIGV